MATADRRSRQVGRTTQVTDADHRLDGRDSFFLLADVRRVGEADEYRAKIRNLSSGGLMAEGDMRVTRGQAIEVALRNLGWVEGVVAWVQDNRFGVAFLSEIDPKLARSPLITNEDNTPRYVKPVVAYTPGPMRKV
ncbi:MAG: PilZ domain-containing protein [Novosphingobium sp.]|nr:PilZ domain-containing protein [Novosphingobium sp.]